MLEQMDISRLKSERRRAPSRKVFESVFDNQTLIALEQLIRKGFFDELTGIVSAGKEAHIYHGTGDWGEVAIKIYMVEASDFKNMSKYVRGDPRFSSWKNRRQLIGLWASKEFKNLSRVQGHVSSPRPIGFNKNVLVMEFIGEDGIPSPRLKDKDPADPGGYYTTIVDYMRKMYKLRLVHSDLSEYNILDDGSKPVVIDFSAGVLLDHPQAREFLERDVANIVNYFKRLRVDADYDKALKVVTGGD